ncbi:hypothetical protein REPUB_Repub13aG0084200 [Reevesia pubescens]
MAGICCGVVGESEPAAPVEPTSRASRRRRMELRTFKLVANAAVQPPLENDRKRQKLALDLFFPASHRDCDNAVQNSDTNTKFKKDQELNEGLNSNGKAQLETENSVEENESPKYGMSSVCGRRRDMEDAVSIHTSFCKESCQIQISSDIHFFGVFDGHGCSHVAMKCRDRFHEIVKEEIEACGGGKVVEWKRTMERSFERMDKEVQEWTVVDKESSDCRCALQTPQCDTVGSTAVVAVVTPDKVIVANCGDSRAVLCRNGVAFPLSEDHKPDRPDELLRIEEAGGRVIYWDSPRVLGVLAMSRAIGDNYLKPFVISEPEVTITERKGSDECLILASDGLWDVVTNDTACGVARMCLRAQMPPSPSGSPGSDAAVKGGAADIPDKACWDASILLTKLALARHSTDNVSVVVVDLKKKNRQL